MCAHTHMQIWSMHASQAVVRRHGDLWGQCDTATLSHRKFGIAGIDSSGGSGMHRARGAPRLVCLCLVGNGGMDPHSRPVESP